MTPDRTAAAIEARRRSEHALQAEESERYCPLHRAPVEWDQPSLGTRLSDSARSP